MLQPLALSVGVDVIIISGLSAHLMEFSSLMVHFSSWFHRPLVLDPSAGRQIRAGKLYAHNVGSQKKLYMVYGMHIVYSI